MMPPASPLPTNCMGRQLTTVPLCAASTVASTSPYWPCPHHHRWHLGCIFPRMPASHRAAYDHLAKRLALFDRVPDLLCGFPEAICASSFIHARKRCISPRLAERTAWHLVVRAHQPGAVAEVLVVETGRGRVRRLVHQAAVGHEPAECRAVLQVAAGLSERSLLAPWKNATQIPSNDRADYSVGGLPVESRDVCEVGTVHGRSTGVFGA